MEVKKNNAITSKAAAVETPRVTEAFPANIEMLLAGRINTGTKGLLVRIYFSNS